MKRKSVFSKAFPWIGMGAIVAAVVTIGVVTNTTLRSVEKNLPKALLTELNDLNIACEQLGTAAALARFAQARPSPDNLAQFRRSVESVHDAVVDLRETYVFDNMVQASAFHAVVAPAVVDVRIWLAEGISGYAADSPTTIAIAASRIFQAAEKAKVLNRRSHQAAQTVLGRQRARLEKFLFSVNLLLVATLGLTAVMVFLLVRQHRLRRRETESLEVLRQTRTSLQESEELHARLMATIPDLVIRMDMEGKILYVNDIASQLSGYDPSEIIGENMLSFVDEKDLPRAIENTLKMLDGPLGPKEYDLVLKDGRRRRFEVNGELLRDAQGTPFGMVQVCRDISERRKMMEESRRLEERLYRAEKMEALGTLAGGVAHDLNNVLGVLVGYSELMLLEITEEHPLRKHVDNILSSGKRGAAIIQDLLAMARRGVPVSEVVNCNTVIRGMLRTPEFEKLCAAFPRVVLRTDLENHLLNIRGAPVHLEKTVMNLVFNAVEAMDGPGEVILQTENRHLDTPISRYDDMQAGDYVVVRVRDDGPGISPEDLPKIFEPFYTRKVMGRSGTGLGLAVVWGTVKDHRGYVDVQSEPGRGCEFSLYFPATREPVAAAVEPPRPERYQGNGETLLVVDDVDAQREMARHMLEKIGYRVEIAASGEAAVDFFSAGGRADLVILDMIMDPGIDGLETFRRLRRIDPSLRAIIVSGYSETGRVKSAQALGAGAYVRKPYMLETLGMAVRDELDRP